MDTRVCRAVAHMRERLGQRLTIAELAGVALLSPYHFVRVFRREVGRTPHRHLTLLRVREAQRLLEQGLPVTAVAAHCGFSGTPHFSAVFLRHTGLRPSRWPAHALSGGEVPCGRSPRRARG
ncbi:helix-turn-helix domain-containing protein [Actinoplanes sp. RD1]|uniref:helix-turn-helix domain-containing protein n=1 Tax=Actinoplanes sp. RD1 TaxID=3064538 RepID=UPI00274249FB|nr:helix-turn-helix transcriptional regulator [Actinoplanes sp. RD1]